MQSSQCSTMTRNLRLTRPALSLVLLVSLVLFAIALSGCGGKLATYTDPDFGFSFQYDDSWQLRHLAASELNEGVSKSVEIFDPRGSDAGDESTFDSLAVDVIELDPAADVTMEMMTTEFDSYLQAGMAADPSTKVTEQPTATTVGGMPCLRATYTFTYAGTEVRCTEYWILGADGIAYSLYTQSSFKNWDGNGAVFTTFVDSFKAAGSAADTATTQAK